MNTRELRSMVKETCRTFDLIEFKYWPGEKFELSIRTEGLGDRRKQALIHQLNLLRTYYGLANFFEVEFEKMTNYIFPLTAEQGRMF